MGFSQNNLLSDSAKDYFDRLPPFRYCGTRLDNVEKTQKYAPGGYHPVDIGDVISSGEREYEVIHKLGHGGFATVWLVRSGVQSTSYHALKILCADGDDYVDPELPIFEYLKKVAAAGHPNVVDLHDSFKITGPNGEHKCLVFPVLGPRLGLMEDPVAIPVAVRHDICRQVASATAFLHQHGVCHGDLTPYNVVFELPGIESMTLDDFFELLGPIKSERLRTAKGQSRYRLHAPNYVVESPNFSAVDFSSLTRVRVIDFGQAFFINHPPKSLGTPVDFFPPEVCFGFPPSTKSDIWQLASIFYSIQTSFILFPADFGAFVSLLRNIVDCLGPLPQEWRGKFELIEYGYYEMGKLKTATEPEFWYEDRIGDRPLTSLLLDNAPLLSTHQFEEYLQLLRDMLAYDPEKRLSAVEVIQRLDKGLSRSSGLADGVLYGFINSTGKFIVPAATTRRAATQISDKVEC